MAEQRSPFMAGGKKLSKTFSRRIIWRDLAYWQLHHWPCMAVKPIRHHYEGQVRMLVRVLFRSLLGAWLGPMQSLFTNHRVCIGMVIQY